MDLVLRLSVFTVLVAPVQFLAVLRFLRSRDRPARPIALQLVIVYSLCEMLSAAEANYFILSGFMVFFVSLSACDLTHFLIYRTPISASAFGEIFLSTTGEWVGYVASIRWWHLALVAGYLAASAAALAALHAEPLAANSYALPAGIVLGGALLLTFFRGNAGNFYPMRYAGLIAEAAREMAALKRSTRSTKRIDLSVRAVPPPEHQKFIVVVGESVRRHNLLIHGYGRDTTPELARITDELIVFEDAISAANLTRTSLGLALTTGTVNADDRHSERKSIVQAAGAAGFETHWISNQPRLGYHETEVSVIAGQADHVHFLNTDEKGRSLDGRMLPAITDALGTEKPSVIFVHMMGSHPRYEYRTDKAFRHFTADSSYKNDPRDRALATDNYDNTILYLDHILAEIMGACRNSDKPCLLTFFSDHGHSLFDDGKSLYHGLANPVQKEFEVPYFYWATQKFRQRYPENAVFKLPQRVPGRAHLQHLFDDLALVMGLRIDGYDIRGTNLGELPNEGLDDRKVMGREKVFDYAALP